MRHLQFSETLRLSSCAKEARMESISSPSPLMECMFCSSKKHIHVQHFQSPHRFQQRHRIAGETAETFDDDHVDLAVSAVRQQPLEVLSLLCCAGHFIRVNASKNPIRIALNQIAEVADLCGERMQHRVLYAGNPRIGGHALFPGLLSAPPAWFDE